MLRSRTYSSLLLFISLICITTALAQKPIQYNSSEIYHQLKKLNTLGRVMYLAAHPDDENQRIITYFDNERMVDAAYLSLTRGDGGQNLVGAEIRESLGIIRTQELLEARKVDGGEQFFSRANDFGYSKSAEETLAIWDKAKILGDVVWAIRKFRPDIIITRFPPDARAGHGHHTSSAVLAKAAFEISNDPKMYPEQLKYVEVWKPKRIFINTGRWWNDTINEKTPGVVSINVGKYNTLLGESYTEIAARSRSAHKSQGFGATGSRGEQLEFLELMIGDEVKTDALEGVNLTWNRIEGGNVIEKKISDIIVNYNFENPSYIVDELLEVRKMIEGIEDDFWKSHKLKAINDLIIQCSGVYLEMTSSNYYSTINEEVNVKLELINRSELNVQLNKIVFDKVTPLKGIIDQSLPTNTKIEIERTIQIPDNMKSTQPYWLVDKGTLGTYNVRSQVLIGLPENKPSIMATAFLDINHEQLEVELPLVYKWNDPVKGEQYKPFVILPEIALNIAKPVYIFNNKVANKKVDVLVKCFKDETNVEVFPELPQGWKSMPENIHLNLKKGEEKHISFLISPPAKQEVAEISFVAKAGENKFHQSYLEIDYDHIQAQTYLPKATSKIVKVDVVTKGARVGYIQGAGDKVPEALRNMGYEVDELEEEDVTEENLMNYDAVMLGVRALNTNERIKFIMPELLKYSKNGGTLVIQYNTNRRLKTQDFAPFELKLSRDRVSEEDAEVGVLLPNHEVLNTPNKITLSDFDNWVQERGLYFPDTWSEEYAAILSMNDKNESPKKGSLLIAKYGKGYYVYSGLSFFRELPAGVPGAYRLLANIISLGNEN
ncbi:MAG: PIG-L family deacetylase [Cyclobacteriaceae bacterium]|nr:PIG-L family deacetylase [Cyclobacteriaceae bacterium]